MAASTGVAALLPGPAQAADERTAQFNEAYAKLTGGREPVAGAIKLEMLDMAENGNMVPFTVGLDSPMTDADHVRSITILSTGNPQPVIATFKLSPASGQAKVSGRMRLARSQDVIAVAELSDGRLLAGLTNVKVTVGGCGGG